MVKGYRIDEFLMNLCFEILRSGIYHTAQKSKEEFEY